MDTVIDVDNVSKKFRLYFDRPMNLKERLIKGSKGSYTEFYALKDVSFKIKRGSTVGLIGKNGSGKSTMLKIINRTLFPDAGKITVKGKVASLIELGAGFQPELSGRENVFNNATVFGITREEIERRLPGIIEFSELEQFIDNPIRTYSSGMYARLAFSVAINVDAEILLVDEILGVGDMNFQAKCADRIYQMRKEGTTILVVTHDMGTIDRLCDYGIWLDHGKKIDEGEPEYIENAYMTFMSDEKVARKKLEEENRAKEKEEKEQIQKAKANKERITITKLGDHFGSGEILITDCKLMDERGVEKHSFHTGDKMALQIKYLCQDDISDINLSLGIEITNSQGTYIYGTNTARDGFKVIKLKEQGEIKVTFENLSLLAGDYNIGIAFSNVEETANYDYYHKISEFRIYSSNRDLGITRLVHTYEIDGSEVTD